MIDQRYLVSAKSVIAAIYSLCDSADIIGAAEKAGFDYSGTALNTRSVFRHALTKYFLYLTASDRRIEDEEIELLNELLEWDFTKPEVLDIIRDGDIYTPRFAFSEPDILPIMMELDNTLTEIGLNPHAADLLIEAFEICGETVTRVDGREDARESVDRENYLAMLKRFAAQGKATGR